jgi:hypothetical protein
MKGKHGNLHQEYLFQAPDMVYKSTVSLLATLCR